MNRDPTIGVVLVDHGSRRSESNRMLELVAGLVAAETGREIVEPAHMDLAEPTVAQAFDRCVARGADVVVVHPYFLLPGRHWREDIPRLAAQAAARHPHVHWLVTAPLGIHPALARVVDDRVRHCLACAAGDAAPCEVCADGGGCRFAGGAPTG